MAQRSSKRRAVAFFDLDLSAQGLGLTQFLSRDRDAVLTTPDNEEVHGAPILYMDTVFQHLPCSRRKYRSAAGAYRCLQLPLVTDPLAPLG